MNKIFNLIIKRGKPTSLVDKFSGIISIAIYTTVVFLSVYYVFTGTVFIKHGNIEKIRAYNSIITIAADSMRPAIDKNDFDTIKTFSNSLLKNDTILFLYIVDKNTGKIIWSSIKGIEGIFPSQFWLDNKVKRQLKYYDSQDIFVITKDAGSKQLLIGFYNDHVLKTIVDILLQGYVVLALLFIVLGFASAFILAKVVAKPIRELAIGTEEFSAGNLSYRSKINSNDEIGKLAVAFNKMAENLDSLYSSLEHQVKERTVELSVKNEQLQGAYKELQETQVMLIQNEKMSSLGQLVAGIAHELNNPINFIYGNLEHLKNYMSDLFAIIGAYGETDEKLPEDVRNHVNSAKQEYDYEFLKEDLPALIKSCRDGAERCKQIIIDLKNFSRLDEAMLKDIDIHDGLDSTLNILSGKLKNRAIIHKNYGNLPKLSCFAGQLNQVFMNIIDNAVHALKDNGEIFIDTSYENNNIIVKIADNGTGIDKDVLPRIFDPFYTTKPVGEGTGMGLSISYKIIKKHNGKIDVRSEKGKGTQFIISIPIDWHKDFSIHQNAGALES